ncbi:MAG TPA: alpha/beta hydrolase, partial [Acidimicrobiales bacterium]|nr:alpha/beta hydrolase [Acidimicrobiales bacterium]
KRPGTFHSIHCYEPIMFPGADPPPPPPGSNLATGARRRREVFPSRDLAFDNYAGKPPFASFTPEALRDYVTYGFDDLPDGTVRLKCRGENEARVYEGGFSHDAFAHLDEIECPVTIACGALSDIGVPTMEAVAARLRHGHLDVLDGLSHFGPFEDPDAVALSILRAAVTPRA